ncbi:hypothetical protein [Flavilitoribacter nigricans]|uniref:Uncharacterized protein n=1 Tax=Flavilitoribacter nigricans (strain ATCC 23147 / DSM 23189 / NBRC 102662 / NCIMB 1420 / SS-2) TaxID=1122177 RepID=A0A2D0NGR7_FLAN2|nr:hypothetical protein [Flavilitoribacter nigricans]PHN06953.1 hypothetical protein CRP01_09055 [Flavilitoribacter nigricans DSM 23189 = NBRC 102662]
MALSNLTRACGSQLPPGTELDLYFTLEEELAAWPDTQWQVTTDASGTPVQGDLKRIGEAFDFTGAGTDLGFWRKVKILVDTGNVRDLIEGEVGGLTVRSRLDFFIQGMNAEALEWGDELMSYSGCIIAMVPLKGGEYVVLGNQANPCFVESGEGGSGAGTGDRVGHQYTLVCNTGFMPMLYDADTLGIDITPEA